MMEARFDDRRKAVGWILGPAAALLIWILPIDTVSAPAHRLAGVLAWVGVYWVTEPIPIPVTALWGAALCVVMGVGSAKEVLSSFAHPVIFLFLGSFLLAEAMTVHGLDRRIAVGILSRRWVGADPYRLLFTTGGLTAFLSMWISNTAAAAMMFPIALGLLSSIQADSWTMKPAPYKTGFMLMTAYSASVGGIGTLIGTPPNLIGVGLIEQQTGVRLSFLQWMSFGLPMLVLMYLALYLLLSRRFPWSGELRGVAARLQEERMRLGGFTVGQRNVLSAFGVAVTLWVFPGVIALWAGTDSPAYQWYDRHLPEGISAILAAGLLFFLPTDRERGEFTLNWEQASRIDWGTILLFGGGLALGDQMFKTGLAEAMGKGLVEGLGFDSLWMLTGLAVALGILISELTSNTASANMVIPVMIAMAQALGVSPLPPALGGCLGASYGFMLPISTPPNAIVYGSGLIPITQMIRAGVVFDILGFFIIWLGLRLLCPLLGLI